MPNSRVVVVPRSGEPMLWQQRERSDGGASERRKSHCSGPIRGNQSWALLARHALIPNEKRSATAEGGAAPARRVCGEQEP